MLRTKWFLLIILAGSAMAQNWQKIKGIDSTDVISVVRENNFIYALTFDQIFYGELTADSLMPTPGQPNTSDSFNTLFIHNGRIYLGTLGSGVYYSDDQGLTWQTLNTGLSKSAQGIMSFTVSGDSLYAGSNYSGVFAVNLLNPSAWSPVNNGLFNYGITTLGQSGHNIFASIGYNLFVKGRNEDQWYTVYPDSVQMWQVYEILPVAEHLFAGTDRGIYRSSDHGQHWEKTDIRQFPNAEIIALAYDGTKLFAGLIYRGQHWIFSSSDLGQTWTFRAHEFSFLWDLLLTGDRWWAGRTDGLWYWQDETSTGLDPLDPELAAGYHLQQNYPNPFNPLTTIAYQLPEAGTVRIDVFNVQGRHIKTLLDEYKNAGNYSLVFDGSGLASGVYFYQMSTAKQIQSKKMVYIK